MNRVLLQAQVVERAALRYTPAGLPAVDVRLAHASQVEHAGQMRQISCEIHATAVDGVATQLNRIAVGQTVDVAHHRAHSAPRVNRLNSGAFHAPATW
jgi:primosomal replication protein N